MDTDRSQILDRIRQAGPGRVFTPKDFLDTVNRDAADQALSRLARSGAIKRLARGLYYTPNPDLVTRFKAKASLNAPDTIDSPTAPMASVI